MQRTPTPALELGLPMGLHPAEAFLWCGWSALSKPAAMQGNRPNLVLLTDASAGA